MEKSLKSSAEGTSEVEAKREQPSGSGNIDAISKYYEDYKEMEKKINDFFEEQGEVSLAGMDSKEKRHLMDTRKKEMEGLIALNSAINYIAKHSLEDPNYNHDELALLIFAEKLFSITILQKHNSQFKDCEQILTKEDVINYVKGLVKDMETYTEEISLSLSSSLSSDKDPPRRPRICSATRTCSEATSIPEDSTDVMSRGVSLGPDSSKEGSEPSSASISRMSSRDVSETSDVFSEPSSKQDS